MLVDTLNEYQLFDTFNNPNNGYQSFSLDACRYFIELSEELTGDEPEEFYPLDYHIRFNEYEDLDELAYMVGIDKNDYIVLNPWYHFDHYDIDAYNEAIENYLDSVCWVELDCGTILVES